MPPATRLTYVKISVIGCGYLGAVHAVAMAELGHEVIGVDVDATRIARLNDGQAPFYEPDFERLLASALASGRLHFTTNVASAAPARVHFLAVGTPQSQNGDAADLSFVNSAVDSLLPHLQAGSLLVGKSTVPVGTAATVSARLASRSPDTVLAWNPEFLREGFAVQDTLRPDRIIYGVPAGPAGNQATLLLDEVYADAITNGVPRLVTDYATAELVKVAANAFLATKISFINAMAEISEATGADVTQLADAIGMDARIGRRFLNAGVGFGGGCLPKDIRAFSARAEELGLPESVAFLREVDHINLRQRTRMVELAQNALGGRVAGRRVAVLGASFKPDSDDVRDSPALDIAIRLASLGAEVTVADPAATENARLKYPTLCYTTTAESALTGAELVLLLTEWQEFRQLDPVHARALTARPDGAPPIIDGRNCLDAAEWITAGWRYVGVGRHHHAPQQSQ